jgi:hypothetical protein
MSLDRPGEAPALLLSIDGLRPDALAAARCPNLQALLWRSAWSLSATSLMPCITLPVHLSIFHSVPPSLHGTTTNAWQPMARPLPGLIDIAHRAGLRTAAIYNWEPLRDCSRPESLDFAYHRFNFRDANGDQVIAEEAARYLGQDRPDLAFVYFGTVDQWGHQHGWMSGEYLAQVERVDRALATLLAALPSDLTLLIVSDHGGHARSHGSDIPEDMTVPFILAGPQIRQGYEIPVPVSLLDVAPTLAAALGLPSDSGWEGRVVEDAFGSLV